MARKGETFLVIDIGSSKISGTLGEIRDREIIIHASNYEPTTGISGGKVTHIEEAKRAITSLIRKLRVKGVKMPKEAHVLITGSHLANTYSKGIATIGENNHREQQISAKHIRIALEQAKKIRLPQSKEIVSVFPSAYYVDGDQVKRPYNMMGIRLEIDTFILTGESTPLRNIEIALLSANIRSKEYLYQPIMASYGVLDPEDLETGILLIDIGKDTTDIAAWSGGTLLFSKTLNIGGDTITYDIANILHLRRSDAEKLKIEHGNCDPDSVDKKALIPIEVYDGEKKSIYKRELAEIIRATVEDIFLEIRDELKKKRLITVDRQGKVTTSLISVGAVLVGGTSLLPGIKEVGKSVLNLPSLSGKLRWKKVPPDMNTPAFASLWGAIEYKYRQIKEDPTGELVKKERSKLFLEDIKDFFRKNF